MIRVWLNALPPLTVISPELNTSAWISGPAFSTPVVVLVTTMGAPEMPGSGGSMISPVIVPLLDKASVLVPDRMATPVAPLTELIVPSLTITSDEPPVTKIAAPAFSPLCTAAPPPCTEPPLFTVTKTSPLLLPLAWA